MSSHQTGCLLQRDIYFKEGKIDILSSSVNRPKYNTSGDFAAETYVSILTFAGSDSIPAGALALLLGSFFDDGQGMSVTVLSAGSDESVDQSDGGAVRSPVGSRFDAGEKYFVAFARERG